MSASHVKRIVQIRPPTIREKALGEASCAAVGHDGIHVVVTNPANGARHDKFEFHSCYDDRTDGPKEESPLYEDIASYCIANAQNRAYGTAVIAYGERGTGKKHTMLGTDTNRGLVLTTIWYLFASCEQQEFTGMRCNLFLSMYEIRNDEILDLLASSIKGLSSDRYAIQNLTLRPVKSLADARRVLLQGMTMRSTIARNRGHKHSHAVITVTLDSVTPDGDLASCTIDFFLLADASSYRDPVLDAKEAKCLRTSFSVLANCLNYVTTGTGTPQWGASALTRRLQGTYETGRYRTILLSTLNPSAPHFQETLRTLHFGSRSEVILAPSPSPKLQHHLKVDEHIQELQALYKYVELLTRALEQFDHGAFAPGFKTGVTTFFPPNLNSPSVVKSGRIEDIKMRTSRLLMSLNRSNMMHHGLMSNTGDESEFVPARPEHSGRSLSPGSSPPGAGAGVRLSPQAAARQALQNLQLGQGRNTVAFAPAAAGAKKGKQLGAGGKRRRAKRPPNLLLVEDVRVSQKMANSALSRGADKYKVVVASDGETAVEKYKQHHQSLQVVLMDIGLPGISGVEAAQQIRQYEDEQNLEPVTMLGLTGNVESDNLASYEAAGMNGCIMKGKLIPTSVKDALQQLEKSPDHFVNLTGVVASPPKTTRAPVLSQQVQKAQKMQMKQREAELASQSVPLAKKLIGEEAPVSFSPRPAAVSLLARQQQQSASAEQPLDLPGWGGLAKPGIDIGSGIGPAYGDAPSKRLVLREKVHEPLFGKIEVERPPTLQEVQQALGLKEKVEPASSQIRVDDNNQPAGSIEPEASVPVVSPKKLLTGGEQLLSSPPVSTLMSSSGSEGESGGESGELGLNSPVRRKRGGRRKRLPDLLLVEDVRVSQKIANTALSRGPDKYKVVVASDGETAVEKYKQHHDSLRIVLMDIGLPGISGVEAAQQIRQYEEEQDLEPVTMLGLTGNMELDNLHSYQAAGMNGCIMKGKVVADAVKAALQRLEENPDDFVSLSS